MQSHLSDRQFQQNWFHPQSSRSSNKLTTIDFSRDSTFLYLRSIFASDSTGYVWVTFDMQLLYGRFCITKNSRFSGTGNHTVGEKHPMKSSLCSNLLFHDGLRQEMLLNFYGALDTVHQPKLSVVFVQVHHEICRRLLQHFTLSKRRRCTTSG